MDGTYREIGLPIELSVDQDNFRRRSELEIEGEDHIRPVTWQEWVTLAIREQDQSVRTVRGEIRVPTVIVLASFAKVPKKRPKLYARTIRERDGNRCQ